MFPDKHLYEYLILYINCFFVYIFFDVHVAHIENNLLKCYKITDTKIPFGEEADKPCLDL